MISDFFLTVIKKSFVSNNYYNNYKYDSLKDDNKNLYFKNKILLTNNYYINNVDIFFRTAKKEDFKEPLVTNMQKINLVTNDIVLPNYIKKLFLIHVVVHCNNKIITQFYKKTTIKKLKKYFGVSFTYMISNNELNLKYTKNIYYVFVKTIVDDGHDIIFPKSTNTVFFSIKRYFFSQKNCFIDISKCNFKKLKYLTLRNKYTSSELFIQAILPKLKYLYNVSLINIVTNTKNNNIKFLTTDMSKNYNISKNLYMVSTYIRCNSEYFFKNIHIFKMISNRNAKECFKSINKNDYYQIIIMHNNYYNPLADEILDVYNFNCCHLFFISDTNKVIFNMPFTTALKTFNTIKYCKFSTNIISDDNISYEKLFNCKKYNINANLIKNDFSHCVY